MHGEQAQTQAFQQLDYKRQKWLVEFLVCGTNKNLILPVLRSSDCYTCLYTGF